MFDFFLVSGVVREENNRFELDDARGDGRNEVIVAFENDEEEVVEEVEEEGTGDCEGELFVIAKRVYGKMNSGRLGEWPRDGAGNEDKAILGRDVDKW